MAKEKTKAKKKTAAKTNGLDTQREVEQFLYRQAEILDAKQWADFIDLFTADGHYWMPATPDQTTGEGVPSIFYEDRDLMTVRMTRVGHPHAWSQAPAWGTSHLVSNVVIEKDDKKKGEIVARSRFHMMEFRRDASRHFAGTYRHHLRRTSDGLRILEQRVDMVNGEGVYDYVLQVWV
ncbi:MAG: aromatic-ring-hydroxylating dioxygenase subunit beta [Minwuiales bacterium]|nr:aromatic-ring-hydroxylating dioxygenase subunit beta [Minwuiales bacterium]